MDAISGRAYALRDEEEEDDKQFIEVAGHLGFFHGVVGAKRALVTCIKHIEMSDGSKRWRGLQHVILPIAMFAADQIEGLVIAPSIYDQAFGISDVDDREQVFDEFVEAERQFRLRMGLSAPPAGKFVDGVFEPAQRKGTAHALRCERQER